MYSEISHYTERDEIEQNFFESFEFSSKVRSLRSSMKW